ncbi:cytochrome c nitrite reductase small subunit, partial [Bacteroides uniformis]
MAKLPIISKLFPSYRWKVTALIVCGVLVGSGGLFM